jgi:diguanylate cyclase (GGDEF)-like protein/PAS domain S-box-containing protein
MSIKNDWNSVPPLENAIDPNPLIVLPDRPLDQVIELMNQANAHNCRLPGFTSQPSQIDTGSHRCVLVMENQQLLGIFTERDIIDLIATQSLNNPNQITIDRVMRRSVITLTKTEHQDIFAALSLLREHQIRYLPVLDIHRKLIGIVTPETIRACVQPANLLQWRTVRDVMITEVFQGSETNSVASLIQLMAKEKTSFIVITAAEDKIGDAKAIGSDPVTQPNTARNYHSLSASKVSQLPLMALGIVSEQEILQCQVLEMNLEKTQARDIMSSPILKIAPNESLWVANQQMQQHQTHQLVVCGDRGELLGLLTHHCILQVFDVLEMSSVIEGLQQSIAEQTIQLIKSNEQLHQEIKERQRTEEKLQKLNYELENRVMERTIALQTSNDELIAEMIRRKQVQEALRESQERLWSLIQTAGSVIIFLGPDHRILQWNLEAERVYGWQDIEVLGESYLDICVPWEMREQVAHYLNEVFKGNPQRDLELPGITKDGNSQPILLWNLTPLFDTQGEALGAIISGQEITERKQAEEQLWQYKEHLEELVAKRTAALTQANQKLRREIRDRQRAEQALFQEKELAQVTLQSIGEGVITTDAHGYIQLINPMAEEILTWDAEEAFGLPVTEVFKIVHEKSKDPLPNPIEAALLGETFVDNTHESVLMVRNGKELAINCTAAPIRASDSKIVGAVLVFRDVTHSRNMARQLSWQASHDPLTGLINRREFERRLESAVIDSQVDNLEHTLCYLDLDRFKIVNDTSGHAAGDELLRQVSTLLSSHLRRSDVLGRLGGDEFAAILYNCSVDEALRVANGMRESIKSVEFVWENHTFTIGVSIGLVAINAHSANLQSVLSEADAACYKAKKDGRDRVEIHRI